MEIGQSSHIRSFEKNNLQPRAGGRGQGAGDRGQGAGAEGRGQGAGGRGQGAGGRGQEVGLVPTANILTGVQLSVIGVHQGGYS